MSSILYIFTLENRVDLKPEVLRTAPGTHVPQQVLGGGVTPPLVSGRQQCPESPGSRFCQVERKHLPRPFMISEPHRRLEKEKVGSLGGAAV